MTTKGVTEAIGNHRFSLEEIYLYFQNDIK